VKVIATDVNETRLEFCRRQLGVEYTFPTDGSAEEALGEATRGEMPTVVFEATGNAASMERSFGFVASGGKLVLVGLCQSKIAFFDPEFHRREMTLLSSRNALASDFKRVLTAVEAGTLDTRPWITHRASLADLGEALPSWMDPGSRVLKAMVELS
jgi:threonine dehydrogenase-like Zn-dependent dehydrogenase